MNQRINSFPHFCSTGNAEMILIAKVGTVIIRVTIIILIEKMEIRIIIAVRLQPKEDSS
jgi:hypothetical protein